MENPGYTDTPTLPQCGYRVHDPDRPHPEPVDPGGALATGEPPSDATVLFDGNAMAEWEHEDGRDVEWHVEADYAEVAPGTGNVRTERVFGDCQLHLEWASPPATTDDGQGRGNSGVFLMDRYEIQVLDNYDNPTYADGYAGAVYGQSPPLVNASRPPGEWQCFDIVWNGPHFREERVERPAVVTVFHNGVLVQHRTTLLGETVHRAVAQYENHPTEAPLALQDHGDRVRFRNIWVRPL
ncbi:DUF1080 domain-containing protein [Halomarina oriensis]|uniref:DUF1080 domain-containing protein n=2 Tax=Halomarina oriensis TaxID=671145 RepID=A0A6B0GM45_9EURY|nr:DUF1080 domain-containing protein [Halomarina oriensis]MWG33823.1 DUF1080 domain-containing protein [Halomarina oriensis]